MLHLNTQSILQHDENRDWFAEQIRGARTILHHGHREVAEGMHIVLANMGIFGNLRGTDTGEQMLVCIVALSRCIGRDIDKEMNARFKEVNKERILSGDSSVPFVTQIEQN